MTKEVKLVSKLTSLSLCQMSLFGLTREKGENDGDTSDTVNLHATMDKTNPDQLLTELMKIDVQMRETHCSLETKITTQEITPSGEKPPEATPEKVEHVAEKIIMALKNIEGQYRKYYYLFPQRREHASRRSFREDSGIGSGIFNDDPAATEVCVPPIQESQETPDTEKTSAVEHSEGSDKEVSPQKTSAVEGHSEGSDKEVSPQKTSAVEGHSEGSDKESSHL
ncbi:uncharacterized protein LOC124151233 isoform X2 [Haliotis rufescens]|uniref:uncharacterized protein LOC124151233 isoform X2 n=1 Tax=Haliotis rufescens TaxID=6454 RepID=UPI00201E8793|nr:uncharacterized protein LOC124151233 isoform X2 [Haliotis rufescens]